MERVVLRAMCQGTGSLRTEAVRRLADYTWREPIHHAIFSCLSVIPSIQPDDLRRGLLTCLTRKGFPDVDVESLFRPHPLSTPDFQDLVRRLTESR